MSDMVVEELAEDQVESTDNDGEPLVETLIEEISIDGMCGVY